MTEDITVQGGNVNTKVSFKNCTSFKTCRAEIIDDFVDEADYIYNVMHTYSSIEYSDNYFNTLENLKQFKRDKIDNDTNIKTTFSSWFKYIDLNYRWCCSRWNSNKCKNSTTFKVLE